MRLSRQMKMSELLEGNYHLIGILSRLGVKGNLGERTVEEVCARNKLDADTFILLCTVYSSPQDYKPSPKELSECSIDDILRYLHNSHEYYMNSALKNLSPELEDMMAPAPKASRAVVRKFFEDYKTELTKHFAYEEDVVIPYVQKLLLGTFSPGFSIADFERNHSNIEESLSDLRGIVMQSLPAECNGEKRLDVLSNIFHLQEDLRHHTHIEDGILVPLVQMLEGNGLNSSDKAAEAEGEESEALSGREKEVLVLVAKGLLNKEIADRLNISVNTVITHRKNITRKTGVKTAAGLTVYCILNGLVDINSFE